MHYYEVYTCLQHFNQITAIKKLISTENVHIVVLAHLGGYCKVVGDIAPT